MDELHLPLSKKASYAKLYDKNLLAAIPRALGRASIGLHHKLPFVGGDLWNCYELSWLDQNGKPQVRIMEFFVPYNSPRIIESKSLKLYLNSFNGTKFIDDHDVLHHIKKDLDHITGADISIKIKNLNEFHNEKLAMFDGVCLDDLNVKVGEYIVDAKLLKLEDDLEEIEETVFSNLLKSNCLVTNQPDWASVQISYRGRRIDHKSLLKYLISFRDHSEFHEQCVEHIFNDIMLYCLPKELTVYAKYTRRGGIDINPYRTIGNFNNTDINKYRDTRQ